MRERSRGIGTMVIQQTLNLDNDDKMQRTVFNNELIGLNDITPLILKSLQIISLVSKTPVLIYFSMDHNSNPRDN